MDHRGAWLTEVPLVLSGRRPGLSGAQPLTDATFAQVLSAPAAVVDLWAPTCPRCMEYKPIYEDVANQMGGSLLMATVNVNDAPAAAAAARISVIPTTIFYVGGKEVSRVEGVMGRAELLQAATRVAAGSTPAGMGVPTWGLVAGGLAAAGIASYFLLFR